MDIAADSARTAGQPGKRERNKLEKRGRIVSAARQLFAERGFEGTTTFEIARIAGVGAGTLFLYAASKEDLLILAFIDEFDAVIATAFEQVDADAPFVDRLVSVFDTMLRYHARDLDLSGRLIREIMFVQDKDERRALGDVSQNIQQRLVAMIEADRARGTLHHDFDATIAADTIFAIFYGRLTQWLSGYTSLDPMRESLREALSLLSRALVTGERATGN